MRFVFASPVAAFVLALASTARADDAAPLPPLPPPAPPAGAAPASPSGPAPRADRPPAVVVETDDEWSFPSCNGTDPEGTIRMSTGCTGVVGLRGSVSHVDGVTSGAGAGLMFSAEGEEYWRHEAWSSRAQYDLALGGGSAGLEGALLGSFAFGFRAPVGKNHGPVFRAGAYGYLIGDDAFSSSLLELPQLQAGWQWSRGHAVLEIAGTTGVVLLGRFRGGDAEARDLGHGFAYGGHASVAVPWVRLSVEIERLPTDDGVQGPVDVAMGTACAVASPLAICADGRVMQASAIVGVTEPFVRAAYAGITIGFTGEH